MNIVKKPEWVSVSRPGGRRGYDKWLLAALNTSTGMHIAFRCSINTFSCMCLTLWVYRCTYLYWRSAQQCSTAGYEVTPQEKLRVKCLLSRLPQQHYQPSREARAEQILFLHSHFIYLQQRRQLRVQDVLQGWSCLPGTVSGDIKLERNVLFFLQDKITFQMSSQYTR